jgi:hypothetical protein
MAGKSNLFVTVRLSIGNSHCGVPCLSLIRNFKSQLGMQVLKLILTGQHRVLAAKTNISKTQMASVSVNIKITY